MSIDNKMKYSGSRNFISEQVYDEIWNLPKGTIVVKIVGDNFCEVEVEKCQ